MMVINIKPQTQAIVNLPTIMVAPKVKFRQPFPLLSRHTPQPQAPHPRMSPATGGKTPNFALEIIGLVILSIYTIFSALQWAQIRWTNRLTREALNASDQTLHQTMDKMQLQIDATNSLAGYARAQAGSTNELANNALNQAKASVESAETAREAYEATARPYIGTGLQGFTHGNPANLQMNAIFTNYGAIPAENVFASWNVVLDGVPIPISPKLRGAPFSIFPTGNSQLTGELGYVETQRVKKGESVVVVYTVDEYHWRGKNQTDCHKFQYSAFANQFFDLGRTCYPR